MRRRRFLPILADLEPRLPLDGDVAELAYILPDDSVDISPEEAGYKAGVAGSSLTGGDWGGFTPGMMDDPKLEPVPTINPYT